MPDPRLATGAALAALAAALPAQLTLEYRGRYDHQRGQPDHLMGAVALSGERAIAASNLGLALLDLRSLPVGGTSRFVDRLVGLNARDLYPTEDERHVFVNLHRDANRTEAGFGVVAVQSGKLQPVAERFEPGVLYEKMCLAGSHLFVAAHAHGLRVFDVRRPDRPALVGRLDRGFVNAFAIAVEGDTAYVADGGGGLKVIDVSDPRAPRIVAGETLATAIGTYEDVSVRAGRVYCAAGGAGLAVYEAGKLSTRATYPLPGFAESLTWVGTRLAVGSIARVTVFEPGAGTRVTEVASENAHRRGATAALRLASDVAAASGDRLLVSNWDYLDVYEMKPASTGRQPDVECDTQRIRFAPGGGTRTVELRNNGGAPLRISRVTTTSSAFRVRGAPTGTLQPGERVELEITYTGGSTALGDGNVLVWSNDPDENPLPIQVFGNTIHLDAGEVAPDFTLPTLARDPVTGGFKTGSFTLSHHRQKLIWLFVYGSW